MPHRRVLVADVLVKILPGRDTDRRRPSEAIGHIFRHSRIEIRLAAIKHDGEDLTPRVVAAERSALLHTTCPRTGTAQCRRAPESGEPARCPAAHLQPTPGASPRTAAARAGCLPSGASGLTRAVRTTGDAAAARSARPRGCTNTHQASPGTHRSSSTTYRSEERRVGKECR